MIDEVNDRCAVLYQLITPEVACDLTSRGLRSRLSLEWWSNNPLISPNRLSNFVLKLRQSLVQYFMVDFTVRISLLLHVPCGVNHVTNISHFVRYSLYSVLIA